MFGGPSGSEQVLNCAGGLPGESVVIEANTVDAQWRARLYNGPLGKMTIDGPPIAVGMWTHLALVYDDSRIDDPAQQAIFYVNAEPFTGDATGSRTHGATNVWPNRLASPAGRSSRRSLPARPPWCPNTAETPCHSLPQTRWLLPATAGLLRCLVHGRLPRQRAGILRRAGG